MGSYDSETESYVVAATTLSLWAGLFGLMYVIVYGHAIYGNANVHVLGSFWDSSSPVGSPTVSAVLSASISWF